MAGLLSCTACTPTICRCGSTTALDSVRPLLGQHGGDVELLGVDEEAGAVHLRLLGSCDGCPSSSATLKGAVEVALAQHAPEIVILDVEEPEPAAAPGTPVSSAPSPSTTPALPSRPRSRRDRSAGRPAAHQSRAAGIGRTPVPDGEVCELCAEPIGERARPSGRHLQPHAHVRLLRAARCSSPPPAPEAATSGRVPDRYLAFPDFDLTPAHWDALQIPVSVAFFFLNSELERVAAFYPGPAGATESLLSLETWDEIVAAQPTLATLQPDVEAFLVRVGSGPGSVTSPGTPAEPGRPECYLVPIDACYDLVGRLRKLWRGFDGGARPVAPSMSSSRRWPPRPARLARAATPLPGSLMWRG